MDKLSTEAIERRMADFEDWVLMGESLQRTFGFDDGSETKTHSGSASTSSSVTSRARMISTCAAMISSA